MNYTKFFVIQIALVFFASAFSVSADEIKTFTLKQGSVKFSVPEKWKEARNLFGIQLTLLGPENGSSRPVITIDSTDFSEFKFDSAALKKNDESYQAGRKKWLSKYDGEAKEFYPYKVNKLMNGKVEDHVLGFRYQLGADEFVEHSHFIKCKKNLYNFKVLLLTKEESLYKKEIEKLFSSFECVE